MKPNRNIMIRWILSILYIAIGVALIVCDCLQLVDEFWSGMGTAFAVIGVLQMIRLIRYKNNAIYKEDTDTAVNDERNRFIGMKAWSWAGYLFVFIAAVATIMFKLMGQELLMFAASGSVCLMLVLYWIIYFILNKKY